MPSRIRGLSKTLRYGTSWVYNAGMLAEADHIDLGKPFGLGPCVVNPETGRIRRAGRSTKLPPQAMDVLTCLARHPREVVSRAEIEAAVWQGRVVGYDSLTGIMFKLRKALGDDTKSPRMIETVSKRGYRLLVEPAPVAPADGPVRAGRGRWRPWAVAAAALVLAGTAAAAWMAGGFEAERADATPPIAASVAPREAIVLLPFENLDGNAADNPVAGGLTDDLTTALAKNPKLLVIARDSAFLYEGAAFDYREIAARLHVDHILRGSVRRVGDQLRVNVQLVDAANGAHVWADSFDGDAASVFNLEDGIVRGVTAALTGDRTERDESALVVRTSSPRAYKAFVMGRQHFLLYRNKSENAKARGYLEEALRADPHFAMARAMLARTYAFDAVNGWAPDREAALDRAEREANAAIADDPGVPLSYFVTGVVFRERNEYVKAMVEAEKAIKLDPNYANAHVLMASLLYYAGRPLESIERLKTAMQINPHHPFNYFFHLGQAYFTLGDYANAIDAFNSGLESNPASERLHVWLAASYAQAGRMDDAEWEVEQVRTLNPEFSVSALLDAFPFKDVRDRDRFIDGLRKAGLS